MGATMAMLPFFILGAFMLRRYDIWRDWRVGALCLCAYMVGVFVQGDIWTNGLSFYGANMTWFGFMADHKLMFLYFARLANGFLGCVGVMWLLKVIVGRLKWVARLAPFGTTTLGVYILHQWLLDRIVDLGWHSNTIGTTLVCTMLIFLFCHFLVIFTKRFVFLRLVVWGDGMIS